MPTVETVSNYSPERLAELQGKFDKSPAEMSEAELQEFIHLMRLNSNATIKAARAKSPSGSRKGKKAAEPSIEELLAQMAKMVAK